MKMKDKMIAAVASHARGMAAKHRMNVEVYLHNPVGIGEHPDLLGAIQDQLDVIAEQTERIQVLDTYFSHHEHLLD